MANRGTFAHGLVRRLPPGKREPDVLPLPLRSRGEPSLARLSFPILWKRAPFVSARSPPLGWQPSQHGPRMAGDALRMDCPRERWPLLASLGPPFSPVGRGGSTARARSSRQRSWMAVGKTLGCQRGGDRRSGQMRRCDPLRHRASVRGRRAPFLVTIQARFPRGSGDGRLVDRARLVAFREGSRGLRETVLASGGQPTDHAFERLTPPGDPLPAIHNRLGFWGSKGCSTSRFPGAIPADPRATWMRVLSTRWCFRRSIRQQRNDRVTLSITEQRALRHPSGKRGRLTAKDLRHAAFVLRWRSSWRNASGSQCSRLSLPRCAAGLLVRLRAAWRRRSSAA